VEAAAPVVEAAKEEEPEGKSFGARAIMSHSVGSGTFVTSPYINNRTRYFDQSWDLYAMYRFEVFGHKLTTQARWPFLYQFTTPDTNPARQWVPSDLSFYLIDPEIWREPFTDIGVKGTLRVFVPTSWESINATKLITGVAAGVGLSRKINDFSLSYTFQVRKNFNASVVSMRNATARESDPVPAGGVGVQIPKGTPNTEWTIYNIFGVSYSPIEELTVGYSLLMYSNIRYNTFPSRDEYTSPNAQVGLQNASDWLWPTFSVEYAVTTAIADYVDLPIDLSVGVSASAMHPAQEPDNKGFLPPLVFNMFTSDKAANNYASLSLDITAEY
jgi:hypothetical protein